MKNNYISIHHKSNIGTDFNSYWFYFMIFLSEIHFLLYYSNENDIFPLFFYEKNNFGVGGCTYFI